MYDDILVPTDGSTGTLETLDHAIHIARDNDATLHGLYVVDKRQYRAASKDTKEDVIRTLEEQGRIALDDVESRATEVGLDVETAMIEGIPHKTILDYRADNGIDLVAIGTHGRTGRDRIAKLGSVTERVVQGASVPVLVVDIGD